MKQVEYIWDTAVEALKNLEQHGAWERVQMTKIWIFEDTTLMAFITLTSNILFFPNQENPENVFSKMSFICQLYSFDFHY